MQLPWPAQYKDLMSKIKSYYNIDLKLYYASSQQKVTIGIFYER